MFRIVVSCLSMVLISGLEQQSPEPQKVGPVLAIEKTEYDLGTIGPDQNEIVGTVEIGNIGDQPLEISRVLSSCQCFSGFFGDTAIAPSGKGVIFVTFSKNKIPKGPSRQAAQIQTNDPKNRYSIVYFNFIVERSAEQEEQYQLCAELESLRQEIRILRQELKTALEELKELKGQLPAAAWSAVRQPAADPTVYDIEIGDSPVLGRQNAPVTIVEFSDFQCPYCVREYPVLKQMIEENPGKIRLVFKHYPLSFHTKAKSAHAAAELAKRELGNEGFWKLHDLIISNFKKLEPEDLLGYARQIGLDTAKLDALLNEPEQIDKLLADDFEQAEQVKVRGTPTILINGLKLTSRTPEAYRRRIDELLEK